MIDTTHDSNPLTQHPIAAPPAFDRSMERAVAIDRLASALLGETPQRWTAPTIARYSVLRRLGSGGMGVVYLGYDEQLDRRVAIKMLRADHRATAQQRMLREAQALARLSHPNVVQVYESGTADDSLYIAMEYISGRTLGGWLAEAPRSITQVLALFIDAGRGLAAAHAANLVHRDFKPDNVMIADDGRVKVMDFGLVHPSDRAEAVTTADDSRSNDGDLTETGAIMGTPAYMAPEQHQARPTDARSDQFSFCVALWEALYGARPFSGSSLAALSQRVIAGEIDAPPRDADVPAWLRATVLRGMATDPAARWPSMDALLEQLARDPWRSRRRGLAVGLTIAAALGLGWGASTWLDTPPRACADMDAALVGVWDDERRGAGRAAFEATTHVSAAQTWTQVEAQLDDYAAAWVDARTSACEATQRGEQSDVLLDRRMACLDDRLVRVRALVDIFAQADVELVGRAIEAIERLPDLERCADTDALMAEIPPPEDPEVARQVTALQQQLASIAAHEDAAQYRAGLELLTAIKPEAEALAHAPLHARVALREGRLRSYLGELEPAEQLLIRAYELALANRMLDEAGNAAAHLIYVVGYKLARHDQGREWGRHALALALATGSREIEAKVESNLGVIDYAAGRHAAARVHYERTLALQQARAPEGVGVGNTLTLLGNIADAEGRHREALELYERAVVIKERQLGAEHPSLALTLDNLGIVHRTLGDVEKARALHERALGIRERTLGAEHPDLAGTLSNLGNVTSDLPTAQRYHERALAIMLATLGPDHPNVADTLNNLGIVIAQQGQDLALAQQHFERAIAITEAKFGPTHRKLGEYLLSLSNIASMRGNLVDARAAAERALVIVEATTDPTSPARGMVLAQLASVMAAAGDQAGARPLFERAYALMLAALGPEHPHTQGIASMAAEAGLPLAPPTDAVAQP